MIKVITFGFKFGQPPSNYYFDVTFLKNPARRAGASLTDEFNESVMTYVSEQAESQKIVQLIVSLCRFLFEIKADAVIGIGCNSGKHRSVAISRLVCSELDSLGLDYQIVDRDR